MKSPSALTLGNALGTTMPEYDETAYDSTAYRQKEVLVELYVEERLSTHEIGEIFDIAYSTVRYQLKKNDIDRRDPVEASIEKRSVNYANYRLNSKSKPHPVWEDKSAGGGKVYVHQILAIASGEDPHEVFDSNNNIHHKNGIMWDNREENIELVTHAEHLSIHKTGEENHNTDLTEDDVREIKKLLRDSDMSQREIGNKFGINQQAVSKIKHEKRWGHVQV